MYDETAPVRVSRPVRKITVDHTDASAGPESSPAKSGAARKGSIFGIYRSKPRDGAAAKARAAKSRPAQPADDGTPREIGRAWLGPLRDAESDTDGYDDAEVDPYDSPDPDECDEVEVFQELETLTGT